MRVEVLFKSHRYEEFDTSPQTCSEPYRGRGTAVLMEWNLHLEHLREQGVVLTQHWYDGSPSNGADTADIDGAKVPVAKRRVGCAVLLVGAEELDEIVWLKKDGEKLLWREGNSLINGERFFAMEQLCYSDATVQSVNRRACAVFEYLSRANPELSDAEVAELMGYTLSAVERIRSAEIAQMDDDVPDGEDLAGEADDGDGTWEC